MEDEFYRHNGRFVAIHLIRKHRNLSEAHKAALEISRTTTDPISVKVFETAAKLMEDRLTAVELINSTGLD